MNLLVSIVKRIYFLLRCDVEGLSFLMIKPFSEAQKKEEKITQVYLYWFIKKVFKKKYYQPKLWPLCFWYIFLGCQLLDDVNKLITCQHATIQPQTQSTNLWIISSPITVLIAMTTYVHFNYLFHLLGPHRKRRFTLTKCKM